MSYTSLKYHLVFATKNRRPWLDGELSPSLVRYLGGILRALDGKLLEANGPEDHLHIVVMLHQARALSDIVREVKASSSKWIHQTFPQLSDFAWQDGYSAFTVSQSVLPEVVRYVRQQGEHHRKMTFREEIIALLRRHDIDFDERYVMR